MIQMKKRIVVALCAILLLGILVSRYVRRQCVSQKLPCGEYVPFDESMLLNQYKTILDRPDFRYVYTFFKDIYEKHSFAQLKPEQVTRIPNILHIMWLGGKVPSEYDAYVASWRNYHPDWTVLFWTDTDLNYDQGTEVMYSFGELDNRLKTCCGGERIVVDARNLMFDNRGYYDGAQNYGERSDILKWEIVYRIGGVYVDTDFECLKPLDVYNHTYDFYTGIQPLDTNIVQLGAALYGAIPKHPILKACVENIKHNQGIAQIIAKTGPIHFTKTFLGTAGTTGLRDIALPSSYFYPCGYEQKGTEKAVWCKAESYAVHHWAGSWLKPEAFVYG